MPEQDEPIQNPNPEPAAEETEWVDTPMEEYTEESIQVLEGLEAVRKRPGMYVGDNAKKGLHQMFREVLDNSVDEALAGFCDKIDVQLYEDGSMSVRDNGRGIPVGIHEKMGVSTLTVVMTMLHAGGKFDNQSYKTSGGLHGVGVSCTNALSEWLIAEVKRDGKIHRQRFERGKPDGDVKMIGKGEGTGTFVHWKPDAEVLTETNHDVHIVKNRLRELAYLNPQVTFTFTSEINHEDDEIFHYEKGIPQLVEDVNEAKDSLHKVIYFKKRKDGTELEVALQYHDGYNETILAFSNNIHQPDGGTHVSGFSQALTRVVNAYARKMNFLKEKDGNFSADDVSDGLTAVISIRLPNPSYNSQDKVKLVTPEVQGLVNSLVGDGLSTYFDENPAVGKRIVDKSMLAQRAREAAKKAAEAVKRSSAMDSFGLPGKLSDCVSKNAADCELFLVEGNSAGGSAKGARDRVTQAVLPLRGKILNVEKTRVDKALDNEEIKSLIAALGVGIDINLGRHHDEDEEDGNLFAGGEAPLHAVEAATKTNGAAKNGRDVGLDLAKLRYDKVIIMTDADVDGEHIRTLLLTFFYRYMRPLIEQGHVYLAQPPLYMLKVGANERYFAQDQKELDELIKTVKKKNYTVQRFKGLGEMNADELEETTMNPANRKMLQVKLDPEFMAEIERLFSDLMGDKVEPRRAFIERHAKEALNVDWHY
ncbi:MAG: DNA topoisomerase IV subunit B [Armatimonadetes bacterium]|nr:DNA topoisomerase IV subunit B [Armatimonadota bacterium]